MYTTSGNLSSMIYTMNKLMISHICIFLYWIQILLLLKNCPLPASYLLSFIHTTLLLIIYLQKNGCTDSNDH